MLMIRLQRLGKSKHPSYRLIVSDKRRDPQAKHVEILGHYSPATEPKVIEFKRDRIAYWLSVGAQPSPTVHNLLLGLGVVTGKKQRSVHVSHRRRAELEKAKANAPQT
jgi:small subunit ribosomal protein S16